MCAAASTSLPFARVFVLNLDRRPDRWRSVYAQLHTRAGLPAHCIERVRAIDGARMDMHALHARARVLSRLGLHRVCAPACDRIWGMDLTPAAVGCALTHALLWARIVALGACASVHDALQSTSTTATTTNTTAATTTSSDAHTDVPLHYLVVEDDSLFPGDFVTRYAAKLRHVPADWQLLYVSGLDTAAQCARLRVADGVCRVPPLHRTTNAYAVTPAGAARLLQRCLPLTYQLDTMMTLYVRTSSTNDSSNKNDKDESDGHVTAAAAAATTLDVPYVVDPCCYTLQPPLVVQATRFGSDIQDKRHTRGVADDAAAAADEEEEHARCRAAGWHDVP